MADFATILDINNKSLNLFCETITTHLKPPQRPFFYGYQTRYNPTNESTIPINNPTCVINITKDPQGYFRNMKPGLYYTNIILSFYGATLQGGGPSGSVQLRLNGRTITPFFFVSIYQIEKYILLPLQFIFRINSLNDDLQVNVNGGSPDGNMRDLSGSVLIQYLHE